MSAQVELYAERDQLRATRARLEAELEALVEPTQANARAINRMLSETARDTSSCNPALFPPEQTTREDLPEFFERLADQ